MVVIGSMINLEEEREIFEASRIGEFDNVSFEINGYWKQGHYKGNTSHFDDLDDSDRLTSSWYSWLERANIALEEINRLKEKLAKYESEEVVVVPRIPTKEMLSEFPEVKANDTYTGDFLHFISDEEISSGYQAMIEIGEIK